MLAKEVAQNNWYCEVLIIDVGDMEVGAASELLRRLAQRGDASEDSPSHDAGLSTALIPIVKELGCHPWAILEAAQYVQEGGMWSKVWTGEVSSRHIRQRAGSIHGPRTPIMWEYRKVLSFSPPEIGFHDALNGLYDRLLQAEAGQVHRHMLRLFVYLPHALRSSRVFSIWIHNETSWPEWHEHFKTTNYRTDQIVWDHCGFEEMLVTMKKLSLVASWEWKTRKKTGEKYLDRIVLHLLIIRWVKLCLSKSESRQLTVEAIELVHKCYKGLAAAEEKFTMSSSAWTISGEPTSSAASSDGLDSESSESDEGLE